MRGGCVDLPAELYADPAHVVHRELELLLIIDKFQGVLGLIGGIGMIGIGSNALSAEEESRFWVENLLRFVFGVFSVTGAIRVSGTKVEAGRSGAEFGLLQCLLEEVNSEAYYVDCVVVAGQFGRFQLFGKERMARGNEKYLILHAWQKASMSLLDVPKLGVQERMRVTVSESICECQRHALLKKHYSETDNPE